MKKLIVSGDSCSDINFESICHPTWDFSYPKWPEIVAKELGMKLVCMGKGGQGNDYIYSTIQDEILKTPKDEIGMVIAAWTQSHRKDYQKGWFSNWHSLRVDPQSDLLNLVKKSMRYMISFQTLCERYNLPYCHFQMGNLFENMYQGLKPTEEDRLLNPDLTDDNKVPYAILKNNERDLSKICFEITSYNKYINRFINWPLSSYLDGDTMLDITQMKEKYGKKEDLQVSKLDDHPNALGHKAIADEVIENINKNDYTNLSNI